MPQDKRIGYAVVGMGALAEAAILPAFANSKEARLVALVSGNAQKAKKLARQFRVKHTFEYTNFSECLDRSDIGAVYIATPPGEHEKYTVAAANSGKHVLCEKPLAATVAEARSMIHACRQNNVLLMTAYRKYFEPASVSLKKMIADGQMGRIDIIHTLFSEFRRFGDSSPSWLFSQKLAGGGPLTDLGVYCLNTSRWLVDEDPIAASAISWARDPRLYKEVEEGIAFRLDFSSGLVLQGTAAYSAAFSSFIHLHGEKGWAELAPAFAFEEERRLSGKIAGRWFAKNFKPMNEFTLEIDYFSKCIRENKRPEPDGEQGLRDLLIIEAIYQAARTGGTTPIHY
ncbi:MAG TPA: Gfo/Idh/MocA family oxidoreductase [Candidatus Sulfotelmatobacter sp.]|nr:Gfo/Idh/MocA family oxidoreductase [Candidatus Sulfotelmatobacter sp.]